MSLLSKKNKQRKKGRREREVISRGEETCLKSSKEVVVFLMLRLDSTSVDSALDPPALTSLLSLKGPASPSPPCLDLC